VARFRFSLQAVLEQRRRVEERHQRGVAELEMQRLELERQIRQAQREMAGERVLQGRFLGAGDLSAARMQAGAAGRLNARSQRAAVELTGIYRRLESARQELAEATKARKAIELLRDSRFEQWRMGQARQEAAAADEMAVMRAGGAAAGKEDS
jgi:flagellar protein FliJ